MSYYFSLMAAMYYFQSGPMRKKTFFLTFIRATGYSQNGSISIFVFLGPQKQSK